MKTYLQRWWIINRLYRYQKKQNLRWGVLEKNFMYWLIGIDIEDGLDKELRGQQHDRESRFFIRLFFWDFKKISSSLGEGLSLEVERTISDCIDKSVGYLSREVINEKRYLDLTARGREDYAVSHIIGKKILGNAFVKTILISIILIFVGWYINSHILKPTTSDNSQQVTN